MQYHNTCKLHNFSSQKSLKEDDCSLDSRRYHMNITSGEDKLDGQMLINLKYLSYFPQTNQKTKSYYSF